MPEKAVPFERSKSSETSFEPKFSFADLFAGIGGMRFAYESVGGECLLTSEIDSMARRTYNMQPWRIHSPRHVEVHDVVELGAMRPKQIPSFDVLLAGFPCQPYSIAGLRQGLLDEKGRGQVFLSILEILRKKKPKAFMLENVKGMLSHDGGRTISYMIDQLRTLGGAKTVYNVLSPQVLNSMTHGGVPQNRERVFIVGFLNEIDASGFCWPNEVPLRKTLRQVLEAKKVPEKYFYSKEKYDCFDEIERHVTSPDTAYQWRRVYVRENKSGVCPALTANMGSGGHNVPLVLHSDGRIRKLTPSECMRLQGFDRFGFVLPSDMADAHLYHQFGNSVTVPLIQSIAREVVKVIDV
jgi:DNA (cytosine-5)-methyltransferase 1